MNKKITYFILYFLDSDPKTHIGFFSTLEVSTSDPAMFHKSLHYQCIESHEANYGYKPDNAKIASIQFVSIEVSIFGFRVF